MNMDCFEQNKPEERLVDRHVPRTIENQSTTHADPVMRSTITPRSYLSLRTSFQQLSPQKISLQAIHNLVILPIHAAVLTLLAG